MSAREMKCPVCGHKMNHHADKMKYSSLGEPGYTSLFGGSVEELHECPNCGASASRLS